MKQKNSTSSGIKETYYRDDIWLTIEEMPIHNWIKTCETGDLKFLFKKEKGRVTPTIGKHWLELQQQYIDEFGLDENFKEELRIKKELVNLNCDFVIKRDRFLLNLIKIKELELEQLGVKKSYSFYQIKDYLEKYKGFRINPKETTVIEWYHALKNMSKDGEAN